MTGGPAGAPTAALRSTDATTGEHHMKITIIIWANSLGERVDLFVDHEDRLTVQRQFENLEKCASWLAGEVQHIDSSMPSEIDKVLRDAIPWD